MVLGDDHAWHAGAYLEVVGHLDLWESGAKKLAQSYIGTITSPSLSLNRVTAG